MIQGIYSTSIDVTTIVSQLMLQAAQPLTTYQNKQTTFQTELSSLTAVQSKLAALQNALQPLLTVSSTSAFKHKLATSSDESTLTATADSTAANGTYNVTVNTLATYHKIASTQGSQAGLQVITNVGAGLRTVRFTVDGTDYDIDVTLAAGEDNETILQNFADAINASGAPMSAIVVNETGTSTRLVITADDSGTVGEITNVEDLAGNLATFIQLSTGGPGWTPANELVAAQNADFDIDGLNFVRSTNSVGDAIGGVTLNLLQDAGATSTVTVGVDTSAIIEDIQSYIDAYNTAISAIDSETAYDLKTNTGKPLFHETVVKRMPLKLRQLSTRSVAGQPLATNSLYMIGIEVTKEGEMRIYDSSKLSNALETSLDDVQSLFNDPVDGVATRLDQQLDDYLLPTTGSLARLLDTTNKNIQKIEDKISDFEAYLTNLEEKLFLRWSKVQQALSFNDSLSLFMSQRLLNSSQQQSY
ncbi:MAG: flagellar filament capping protein FliD [Candidatus Omnitrophica bacterium]|nr:flagellar filament capping protein FliD [Candidatus Omnitrophota bacterium]